MRTPIVALTANALDGNRESCLEAGMDDYTTKPIVPEVLLDKLEKWILLEKDEPKDSQESETFKASYN